jgi:hypothetical protein
MIDSAVPMEATGTATTNPAEQASGFILKLYEMISGAPDELIRVSDMLSNDGYKTSV